MKAKKVQLAEEGSDLKQTLNTLSSHFKKAVKSAMNLSAKNMNLKERDNYGVYRLL